MDWLDIGNLIVAMLCSFASGYWLANKKYDWAILDVTLAIWNFLAAFI